MKKIITGILLTAIVYAGGYVWLRHRFDASGTRLEADATGEYRSIHRNETTVWLHSSGVMRPICHLLYGAYWPAGKLEEVLTGRMYWCEDERLIDEA